MTAIAHPLQFETETLRNLAGPELYMQTGLEVMHERALADVNGGSLLSAIASAIGSAVSSAIASAIGSAISSLIASGTSAATSAAASAVASAASSASGSFAYTIGFSKPKV